MKSERKVFCFMSADSHLKTSTVRGSVASTLPRTKIVAVDGPAGSGKSSICATVCREIGWSYVNTGALYRAVGLMAHDRGVSLNDRPALDQMLAEFCEQTRWEHATERLFVGDHDMTPHLGSVEAASAASLVAKMPSVREALMPLQRKLSLSAPKGAMVDGRDIGTVIFPDADLKIFMTASLEQRAMRRLKQLKKTGNDTPLSAQDIMESIDSRDRQDADRDTAPMKQAEDAILFDTSELDVLAAISSLKNLLKSKGLVE
ncbi:MAG: (d)CMP kinase [Proteobacteria bacterium]|nr:(d)CMP kinase [Pseudomonadota bacterium]